ncbi:competence protein CoiA [Domibacillus robiginosus]|uniref:competence protein CoiA n=1 Tax=Domibacillus robiginosus TaxID=1071054 RepID=UPI00067CB4F1|nr:competence protein CoiA family protein [Domibacillus robiginosus]
MLSAVNALGEPVVLAGPEAKLLASQLKEKPHYCPQCGSPVIIKAGDINIPHFSHISHSLCNSFSESESPRHLTGKSDLFHWITQTTDAQLEARLPDGSQRPDILAGNIAVEFQCSTISAPLFKERTEKYTARGLIPFWIYGGKPLERKGSYIKLTPFQRLFLRFHPQLGFYFLSYCPEQKGFTIYEKIVPITVTLCFSKQRFIPLERMTFPPSASAGEKISFKLTLFFDQKQKWITQSLQFGKGRQHPFFQAVYAAGRNPYLLPEQIGLPVQSSIAIRNHPIEWQFYLLLDLPRRPPEETIRRRIELGHLKEQPLPLAREKTPERAALEYIALLKRIGKQLSLSPDSPSLGVKLKKETLFTEAFGEIVADKLIF